MNKALRARVHLKVDEIKLPFIKTLHLSFSTEKTTGGIFLGNTGKTKPSRTGPKSDYYKASVTNSHVPSFSSSGVFERTTSAGSVNVYIRM